MAKAQKYCAPQPCGEEKEAEQLCYFPAPCVATKECTEGEKV